MRRKKMTIRQTVNQKIKDGFLANKVGQAKKQHQRYLCQGQACQKHVARNQQGMRVKRFKRFARQNGPTLVKAWILMGCVLASPALGVEIVELKVPIADLKDTIFKGWMWVPKIGAAVGGCLMAVYNQSIMPLATGAGVGLGIHFYDLYIKADGALI
jgi:hypothetical protein